MGAIKKALEMVSPKYKATNASKRAATLQFIENCRLDKAEEDKRHAASTR